MNIDFSQIKNSKALKVIAIIALPTLAVGAYYGYKYVKKKADERKAMTEIEKMRDKYKEIKTPDDFIEGSKYVKEPNQFGYDFNMFVKKKDIIEKIDFEKLKRLYELAQKTIQEKSNKEQDEFLDLIHLIYP